MSERARRDADRYKEAATNALTLLDWCIEYLASNGHRRIARRLVPGRNNVHQRLSRASRS